MQNLRILIVDDSELMCTHLAQILAEIKRVEIMGPAYNATDACRLIETNAPDVAILDISLPDGSGVDILKKIREVSSSTKAIMFTHHPFPQYETKCNDLGANYFFDKSKEFDKLIDVIQKMALNFAENPKPDKPT